MNRREFLKSLASISASISYPLDVLSSVPESEIDDIWVTAQENPTIFYINEYGALSIDPLEVFPSTRKELLDLIEIGSESELRELAADFYSFASRIESEMEDEEMLDDAGEPLVFDDWHDYLDKVDAATIEHLITEANQWINDLPDENDYQYSNLRGYSGRGNALRYFRDEFEYSDKFNVVVIEGDCPGSSYFAAELRMDLDVANDLALELDIPIRFARQG